MLIRTLCLPLTLIAVMTLSSCTSQDAADASPDVAEPVTSGPGSGDLLVHGVVSRDGEPQPGVEVVVSLWPETDDIEVGDTVDMWTTDPVETDQDGSYGIRVDADELSSRYFPVGQDFLNFDVMISDETLFMTWGSTAWLLEDSGVWRSERSRPGDEAIELSFDLGDEEVTLTDSQGRSETHESTLVSSE